MSISDIFMKFQLVYPGKKFAYQLVQKEYLLITDEWTSVQIFTAPPPWTSDLGPTLLLLTSGGQHWRPVQTCSLEDPTPAGVTSGGGH